VSELAFHLINGIVWGSAIALVALGLSLVFGLVEIINLAHGELYMIGAVASIFVISWLNSFWITIIIVPILIGGFGLVIERYILRKIEKDPPSTLIATFGLSMFIQYLILWGFGGAPRRVNDPVGITFSIGEAYYPFYRLLVAVVSIISFIGFQLFLSRTRYGLWIRSVGQDSELAASLGLPVSKIYWITFGFGSAFAALAGVMMAPIVAVEFKMGLDILVLAFMASIIGGLGNIKGTFFAALLIGVIESLLAIPLSPTYARVGTLIIVCLILVLRPQGLFFRREIIT
jgi:branched-chain amino acid transport system permease protein